MTNSKRNLIVIIVSAVAVIGLIVGTIIISTMTGNHNVSDDTLAMLINNETAEVTTASLHTEKEPVETAEPSITTNASLTEDIAEPIEEAIEVIQTELEAEKEIEQVIMTTGSIQTTNPNIVTTPPPAPVNTDRPVVATTTNPLSTTTVATTQTEPEVVDFDLSGFPANPQPAQLYTDSTGTTWIYNDIFGQWSESGISYSYDMPVELTGNIILS